MKTPNIFEILLVEDSMVDARFTMASLKKSEIPHRLTLVRDGEEAMAFLLRVGVFARAPKPNLILLDLRLPKKDGQEVLFEIRADDELTSIPVVVLTTSRDDADRVECELLGVDGYITKPVDLDKFLALIRELKDRRRVALSVTG